MTYVTVVDDSPAGTVENLDKLMTDILPEPDGLAARYAGMVDGKLCIVAIWDSRGRRPDLHDASAWAPGSRSCWGRRRRHRYGRGECRSSTRTFGSRRNGERRRTRGGPAPSHRVRRVRPRPWSPRRSCRSAR